jgi:hypothetical protein
MTMKVRVLVSFLVALALLFLAGCKGGYDCAVTFGSSTCTPSGTGLGSSGGGGGGGGGGSTAAAFAFAVDQGGVIDGFTLSPSAGTFGATANFTPPATAITSNPGAGMVVAQQVGEQPYVYALFGPLSNELFGWTVTNTGGLTLLPSFPAPLVTNPDAQIPFNQYNMITNPAGTLLFIADSFDNEIFVFDIASTGALTEVVGSPFATPLGQTGNPGNLATDGLGRFLYVTETLLNHTGTEVLGYSIGDGTNGTTVGALTALSTSPFAFRMWQVQGETSGNFLVGTSGNSAAPGLGLSGTDDPNLYVFNILQTASNGIPAGTLTQATGSPIATTYSPLNIAAQPPSSAGEFVYSFSINDSGAAYNPIQGFLLVTTGAQAGTLAAISGFPTSGIGTGHWGQFDQTGANLLVYSSVSNGTSLVTQLNALSIGSTGIPTEPTGPVTLATPGYWVVTDPQ